MMTTSRHVSRIHSLCLITARFLHLSRTSQKKHYNYDLDDLIKWKNETTQIFGTVRKPTKTGKLKKTKKCLNPQIEENLQILGGLSTSRENSWDILSTTPKACSLNKTAVSDDIHLPHLLSSDFDLLPAYMQTEDTSMIGMKHLDCSLKDNSDDIPDDILSSIMPHNAEPVFKQRFSYDKDDMKCEESLYWDKESKSDVVIQRISPIPTTTPPKCVSAKPVSRVVTSVTCGENIRKQAANHTKESSKAMTSKDVIPTNSTSAVHSADPLLTKPKNSKVTQKAASSKIKGLINSSDTSTEDSFKQKLTKNEMFIPKMKPIPLGQNSYASSTTSQLQTEIPTVSSIKSSLTKAVQNLPFEPPESFELITKIPLLPKESNDWQRKFDSKLFHAFKMDVEQMSLRVPPSVKSILNKTMSDLNRFFLNRWREGLIKELGEEGFKKQQDATIRNGVNLHANIMECLSGKPASELQILPENEGHWCSLQSGLAAVSGVKALEMDISHSMLLYRGVFDCLAHYKDMLCLIDWKSSKKPRPLLKNTYDDPVQIAAYIGALNSDDAYIEKYGQVNHGMIVVAYPDGSPAHIHVMNKSVCEEHWQNWTERLYNYYQLTYTEKMATNIEKIDAKSLA